MATQLVCVRTQIQVPWVWLYSLWPWLLSALFLSLATRSGLSSLPLFLHLNRAPPRDLPGSVQSDSPRISAGWQRPWKTAFPVFSFYKWEAQRLEVVYSKLHCEWEAQPDMVYLGGYNWSFANLINQKIPRANKNVSVITSVNTHKAHSRWHSSYFTHWEIKYSASYCCKHSFNKYSLRASYMPAQMLGFGGERTNKSDIVHVIMEIPL